MISARPLVIRAREAYGKAVADPAGSAAEIEALLAEASATGDDEARVEGLRALAQSRRLLYRHDEALQSLAEGLRLARRRRLTPRFPELLLLRGVVHHDLGRIRAAERDLAAASAHAGPDLQPEVQAQRGLLAHNAGRLVEAAECYLALLAAPRVPVDVRAKTANNLALVEAYRGAFTSAHLWVREAQRWAERVGPAYVALVTQTEAWIDVQDGRLTEGLEAFDRAAQLHREAGLALGELYLERTDALTELRLVPEARADAERAERSLADAGIELLVPEAALRVARLSALLGRLDEAVEVADRAAEEFREQGRTEWAARARLVAVDARTRAGTVDADDARTARRAAQVLERAGMTGLAVEGFVRAGRAAAALGEQRRAVESWRHAAELSRGGSLLVRITGSLAAALAATAEDASDDVLRVARRGLSDLERHRAALPSTELRALASGHGAELGALGLRSVVRDGRAGRVLDWMERTRTSALAAVDVRTPPELEDDLGALRVVQAELRDARSRSGRERADLVARLAELEQRIRRRTWTAAPAAAAGDGSSGARRVSMAELRRRLDDRVLVEYDQLDGSLVAVVLERRRARLVHLGATAPVEEELDRLRFALRSTTTGPTRVRAGMRDVAADAVRRLSGLLVQPLGLAAEVPVVVVPVGELQRAPWSALLDAPVSVAPSAQLWAASSTATAEPGAVLLVAGPDLAGAEAEVHRLAAVHEDARVMVPPHSTVAAVAAELPGATLVHLACHGGVRADNPTFSSLTLADGQLTLHDLERGAAAPYRLVLAACDVGSSVTYPGNEVLGFVGTLLAGGTGGVVASTVVVPDEHVTDLMVGLHQGLAAGGTSAEALHAARAGVDAADPDAFPAWCTFTAYGAA